MEDCLWILASQFKNLRDENPKDEYRIERSQYTTNFVIQRYEHLIGQTNKIFKTYTYQFIQRIYPSLDQIIGGFDLGPSMMELSYMEHDWVSGV